MTCTPPIETVPRSPVLGPRPARLTIVDRHLLFAESIAAALESEGYLVHRLDLREPTSSLAATLGRALRAAPRIVLLEPDLGEIGDGTRLVAPLAARGAAVIVVTGSRERARWGEWLRHGAHAVVSKSCTLDEMTRTVRRVRDGLPAMPAPVREALIEEALNDRAEVHEIRARLERLTHRERDILAALMTGTQVRDIARAHVVSEATVRTQVKSILSKLQMRSQLAAVGAAYRASWGPLVEKSAGITSDRIGELAG